MTSAFRTRIARVAVPALAAFALTGSIYAAAPAHAETAPDPAASTDTVTFSKPGYGLEGVIKDASGKLWPAGSVFVKTPDGREIEAYCIEFTKEQDRTTNPYRMSGWPADGLNETQLAQVTDIVSRHAKIGTPYEDRKWETAATQVAVWKVTNNVDYSTIPNTKFRERVAAILSGSKKTGTKPVLNFELQGKKSVMSTGAEQRNVISGVLQDGEGYPVAGKDVTFTVAGKEHKATTNASGIASVELPVSTSKQDVKIDFSEELPPGVVLLPKSSSHQALIAAEPITVSRSQALSIAAFVPPKADEKPTATPKPEPKPKAKEKPKVQEEKPQIDPIPEEMPRTGGLPVGLGLAGAGVLLGAGVAGRRFFKTR